MPPEVDAAAAAWYCIHAAPKQESKVAVLLAREVGAEILAPKIRFRRSRQGQPIWWTEALFPGYLFARFEYKRQHRQIRALPGVSTIVQFGEQALPISEAIIQNLSELVGETQTIEVAASAAASSEVIVVDGPLRGLQLLVSRVLPARDRIAVLLEILGCEREVEIDAKSAIPAHPRHSNAAGALQLRE